MKKAISLLLSVIMIFSVCSVFASAAPDSYKIAFEDCPYDIGPYRKDYVGMLKGYDYGVDYWFTITNSNGTTTDIKGLPYYVEVAPGDSLELTVSVGKHIEPSTLRVLTFPTGTDKDALHDSEGRPYPQYYITPTTDGTYGIKPTQDMTVTVSEWHMYSLGFLYEFPTSKYYKAQKLYIARSVAMDHPDVTPEERADYYAKLLNEIEQLTPKGDLTEDAYNKYFTHGDWDNTKLSYDGEDFFFEVRIPMDTKEDYHYDTYQVFYVEGEGAYYDRPVTYLHKGAGDDGEAIDKRVCHYIDKDTNEWVDVYCIKNVSQTVEIRVANTVTYTLLMLKEFFNDFNIADIDAVDFSSIDFAPAVEYLARIFGLIMKILRGFGVKIG